VAWVSTTAVAGTDTGAKRVVIKAMPIRTAPKRVLMTVLHFSLSEDIGGRGAQPSSDEEIAERLKVKQQDSEPYWPPD
jgi:hypothetical protein